MALTSILVISAISLAIAVSISLLGVDEAKSSNSYKFGQQTIKIAESCIEEALLRLKVNPSYNGDSLNVGSGTCNISITANGAQRTISVTAQTVAEVDYLKNIEVTAVLAGTAINILSWNQMP